MLFALLRASLHEKEVEVECFQEATDDDWKQCHQKAAAQGVMALAWDGVLRLPKELHPSRNMKLTLGRRASSACRTYAVPESQTYLGNGGRKV